MEKLPLSEILKPYEKLGWIKEVVTTQQNGLPILCFRTTHQGPSIWILSGIHGEETAGPIALSHSIDELIQLSKHLPVVVFPMCNPIGYIKGQRYPIDQKNSVGDCAWFLREKEPIAILPEARKLGSYVINLKKIYPPILTLDLHEDCMENITSGHSYVYSQGKKGRKDPFAQYFVHLLTKIGIPPILHGMTRFHEKIINGIIKSTPDGSIDELLSAHRVLLRSKLIQEPCASSVIVIETPCSIPLEQRVNAHQTIIRSLVHIFA